MPNTNLEPTDGWPFVSDLHHLEIEEKKNPVFLVAIIVCLVTISILLFCFFFNSTQ